MYAPLIQPAMSQEPKRGQGSSAVFIARNRFAVLDKGGNQIVVKNLSNEITKKCPSPCATTDAIFYAGTGTLLCRSEDKVCDVFMFLTSWYMCILQQTPRRHLLLDMSTDNQCTKFPNKHNVQQQQLCCQSKAGGILSKPRCGLLQVVMFDVQQRTTLGELSTPFIKYVVWSSDMNHVALLSKHAIIIANKKLGNASTGKLCCRLFSLALAFVKQVQQSIS